MRGRLRILAPAAPEEATRVTPKQILAANLRYQLERQETSIKLFAEHLGVHRRTVERWLDPEHRAYPPRPRLAVAEVLLGLGTGWLTTEHEEVPYV
jgi:hypothetical protein